MGFLSRYLLETVVADLEDKMVFLGGPRQVGKTTFARDIVGTRFRSAYFSWDKLEERKRALRGAWPSAAELVILDEYHKYPRWRNWIKGEFDTSGSRIKFLLTGSARLNLYRRGGDSLQGRYHYHTLYPFTLAELKGSTPHIQPGAPLPIDTAAPDSDLKSLLKFGGFPEPFLKQEERFLRRWNNERVERFFREDVRELTAIRDFGSLALLADMLPDRAGSVLSINSVAQDLQINHRTAAHWLDVFEQMYFCFRLPPYQSRRIAAARKEKKLYLWDWAQVQEEGARVENMVAVHLMKFCSFLHESQGWRVELHYLRDQTGREVDFLVTWDRKPWLAVEVKSRERSLSTNLLYFRGKLDIRHCYQVALHAQQDFTQGGIRSVPLAKFLLSLA